MRIWLCLQCVIIAVYSQEKGIDIKENANVTAEGKIVGGKPVTRQQYPSACLFFNVGAQCAGTIINTWTILTAAHCFDDNKDKDQMVIELESRYLYDFTAREYDVSSFVIHENYNKSAKFACDIALIFLKKRIKFGSKAKKGVLVNHKRWMNVKEEKFVATGWGWTSYGGQLSDQGLMMTELQFVDSKTCSTMHNVTITPDMFCLYGKGIRDTCKGDSGGGILWNNMVVGITSHGDGCARIDKPSVYANVFYFRKWISDQIDNFMTRYCNRTTKKP
ncbi:trypsin alpha-3-like [Ostrinia nubilalis]|uniref:trypsin alpha-3-like n=1 Tax=Ostrinia nubilalis TaxID=29057 RepID=UPI003082256B